MDILTYFYHVLFHTTQLPLFLVPRCGSCTYVYIVTKHVLFLVYLNSEQITPEYNSIGRDDCYLFWLHFNQKFCMSSLNPRTDL